MGHILGPHDLSRTQNGSPILTGGQSTNCCLFRKDQAHNDCKTQSNQPNLNWTPKADKHILAHPEKKKVMASKFGVLRHNVRTRTQPGKVGWPAGFLKVAQEFFHAPCTSHNYAMAWNSRPSAHPRSPIWNGRTSLWDTRIHVYHGTTRPRILARHQYPTAPPSMMMDGVYIFSRFELFRTSHMSKWT